MLAFYELRLRNSNHGMVVTLFVIMFGLVAFLCVKTSYMIPGTAFKTKT